MNLLKNVVIFTSRINDFRLLHTARPIVTNLLQKNIPSINLSRRYNLKHLENIRPRNVAGFYQASRYCSSISLKSKALTNDDSNLSKLEKVKSLMESEAEQFFKSRVEYRAYSKDVVLENFFNPDKPRIAQGIVSYAKSVVKARMYINFWYPKVKMSVTESHVNEKDNSVDIHWRIDILKHSSLISLRSLSPWKVLENVDSKVGHIDGISSFHINENGFIDKHTLRKKSDI